MINVYKIGYRYNIIGNIYIPNIFVYNFLLKFMVWKMCRLLRCWVFENFLLSIIY